MRGGLLKRSVLLISVFFLVHPGALFAQNNELETKKGCIKATLRAIEIELESYSQKLKAAEKGLGPKGNAERFKNRIVGLKAELKKFSNTKVEDYPLSPQKHAIQGIDLLEKMKKFGPVVPPEKEKVSVSVDGEIRDGTILNTKGMTMSGPFYHVAGIVNDDYRRVRPNKTYELTIYLVYKREYFGFIPDYYVYIARW